MDPRPVTPEIWDYIIRALPNLVLFVGMMVNGALSFLLGHAIIPSLGQTTIVPGQLRTYRAVLYVVSAASLTLMFFALYRGMSLAIIALREIYPRFAI